MVEVGTRRKATIVDIAYLAPLNTLAKQPAGSQLGSKQETKKHRRNKEEQTIQNLREGRVIAISKSLW